MTKQCQAVLSCSTWLSVSSCQVVGRINKLSCFCTFWSNVWQLILTAWGRGIAILYIYFVLYFYRNLTSWELRATLHIPLLKEMDPRSLEPTQVPHSHTADAGNGFLKITHSLACTVPYPRILSCYPIHLRPGWIPLFNFRNETTSGVFSLISVYRTVTASLSVHKNPLKY